MAATGEAPLAASTSKPGGALRDAVPVAHPALLLGLHALEEEPWVGHAERGLAELGGAGAGDGAAQLPRQVLHAVADAEDGDAELEELWVDPRRIVDVDAHGTAGEDDAPGAPGDDVGDRRVVRDQLRVDVQLAHAAGDELPILRAEVQHEHRVEAGGLGARRHACAARLTHSRLLVPTRE